MICFAFALLSAAAASPAPPPPQALNDAIPFTRGIHAELSPWTDEALAAEIERLRSRLFIDDATPVLEVGTDLERVFRLAVAVEILSHRASARGDVGTAMAQAARSAAFLLAEAGRAYESDTRFRASVEALVPPPDTAERSVVESLLAALQGARAFAREWFPRALAAVPDASADPVSLAQEGQWLIGEGREVEGLERLTRAVSILPNQRLALVAHETLLEIGTLDGEALAAELVNILVDRFPELAGAFEKQERRAADLRATREFERSGTTDGPQTVAQVARYLRLGRPGAAELAARAGLAAGAHDSTLACALGEVLLATQRPSALLTLTKGPAWIGSDAACLRALRRAAESPPDGAIEPAPAPAPVATYQTVMSALANEFRTHLNPGPESFRAAQKRLGTLVFDEASAEGQAFAQAQLVTLATIQARSRGARWSAQGLYRLARGVAPARALGLVAAGLAQTLVDDPAGAAELYERAFGEAAEPALRLWIANVLAEAFSESEPAKAARFRALVPDGDPAEVGSVALIELGSAEPRWVLTPGSGVAAAIEVRPHFVLLPRLPTSAPSRTVRP